MKTLFVTLAIGFISLTASASEKVLLCVSSDTFKQASLPLEQADGVYIVIVKEETREVVQIGQGFPVHLKRTSQESNDKSKLAKVSYVVEASDTEAQVIYSKGSTSADSQVLSVKIGDSFSATQLVKNEEETQQMVNIAGEGYSCSTGEADIK